MTPKAKTQLFSKVEKKLREVGRTTFTMDKLRYEVEKDGSHHKYEITHKGKLLDGGEFDGNTFEALSFMTYSNEHLLEKIKNEN